MKYIVRYLDENGRGRSDIVDAVNIYTSDELMRFRGFRREDIVDVAIYPTYRIIKVEVRDPEEEYNTREEK